MEALTDRQAGGNALWLGHINRQHLFNDSLNQYINKGKIQGLFLSPQAMSQTIRTTHVYDDGIMGLLSQEEYGEPLVLDLLLADIRYAADLLRPVFEQSKGVDGWAALPVSPLLTSHPETLVASVTQLSKRLERKNILLSIPGFADLSGAIEEIAFKGIPFKISLVFSREQFSSVARAYLRGIKRRIASGLNPSVAAFVSVPLALLQEKLAGSMNRDDAGKITAATVIEIQQAMHDLQSTRQWTRAFNEGAQPLRPVSCLLGDDTAAIPDMALCNRLQASGTVTVIPESFLAEYLGQNPIHDALTTTGEEEIGSLEMDGVDSDYMGRSLQDETAANQVKYWIGLLEDVARKSADLMQTQSRARMMTHQ